MTGCTAAVRLHHSSSHIFIQFSFLYLMESNESCLLVVLSIALCILGIFQCACLLMCFCSTICVLVCFCQMLCLLECFLCVLGNYAHDASDCVCVFMSVSVHCSVILDLVVLFVITRSVTFHQIKTLHLQKFGCLFVRPSAVFGFVFTDARNISLVSKPFIVKTVTVRLLSQLLNSTCFVPCWIFSLKLC